MEGRQQGIGKVYQGDRLVSNDVLYSFSSDRGIFPISYISGSPSNLNGSVFRLGHPISLNLEDIYTLWLWDGSKWDFLVTKSLPVLGIYCVTGSGVKGIYE
jgi:hypothetical protein